jgi:adenylate cyclase class 2
LPGCPSLEIEGPKEAVFDAANRLDLDWDKRILRNYLEIFDVIRIHENLPFGDVTFRNFAARPAHLAALLPLLEAGAP